MAKNLEDFLTFIKSLSDKYLPEILSYLRESRVRWVIINMIRLLILIIAGMLIKENFENKFLALYEYNWCLGITLVLFTALILVWFTNPFKIVNYFFGKTNNTPPSAILKYIGTVCSSLFIIGNFLILTKNYETQVKNLEMSEKSISLSEEFQLYSRFTVARDNFASDDDIKIFSGLYELKKLGHIFYTLDSYHEVYEQIHGLFCDFISKQHEKGGKKRSHRKDQAVEQVFWILETDTIFNKRESRFYELEFSDMRFNHDRFHSKISFERCLFRNVDFNSVALNGTDIIETQIIDVRFEGCDLSGCVVRDSEIHNTTFNDCWGENIYFGQTKLSGVAFQGAYEYDPERVDTLNFYSFSDIEFEKCQLRSVIFDHIDLTDISFETSVFYDDIKFYGNSLQNFEPDYIVNHSHIITATDKQSSLDSSTAKHLEAPFYHTIDEELNIKDFTHPELINNNSSASDRTFFTIIVILTIIFILCLLLPLIPKQRK